MTGPSTITFTATILRKQEDLPRYVIVKREHLGARDTSFSALVQLGDGPPLNDVFIRGEKALMCSFSTSPKRRCEKPGSTPEIVAP